MSDNSMPASGAAVRAKGVIAVHGGAGTIAKSSMSPEKRREYESALTRALTDGQAILAAGGAAIDAVTAAVRVLEDNPLFNAGHGAVLTHDGSHELDASIMDGRSLEAGAVACITRTRNPILAARAVMERSAHVLLVGAGADAFARAHGVEQVEPDYFSTPERLYQLQRAKELGGMRLFLDHDGASAFTGDAASRAGEDGNDRIGPDRRFGTVGAVACDMAGNLAAATSTGGLTNKMPGRVGDAPLIGVGCFADNATCAVSCTGTGEAFMKAVAAHDISALMAYREWDLARACEHVVSVKLAKLGGMGGLVAVDALGNLSLPFNTEGMYRGFAYVGDAPVVAIYR
jgi:beta-aspartyl-peptidase (threonine type)